MTLFLVGLLMLGPPPCATRGGKGLLAAQLLLQVNAGRMAAGRTPLVPENRLCALASWRAAGAAAEGSPRTDKASLDEARRRLYRSGYSAHEWLEGSLYASTSNNLYKRWRELRPELWRRLTEDELEHVGIGVRQDNGLPHPPGPCKNEVWQGSAGENVDRSTNVEPNSTAFNEHLLTLGPCKDQRIVQTHQG